MATSELGSQRQRDGEVLIDNLSKAGIDFSAAFWTFNSDVNEWRLVLITPHIETRGPKRLLRQAREVLSRMEGKASFSLFDLDFESPYSASVASLVEKLPGLEGAINTRINNFTVDGYTMDLMAYFVHKDQILRSNGVADKLPPEGETGA